MFREIKKKQVILENRKPYPWEIADFINEMNLVDWVYSSLRIDGSALARDEVAKILKGEFLVSATIRDHMAVEGYSHAIKHAYDILEMGSDISERIILEFHRFLADGEGEYRRGNPVLLAFGYNPPHASEIPEQMTLLLRWLYSDDLGINPLEKAACLHHRLLEIYPFEEGSEAVARFAMYYFLLRSGFPPFVLNLSEQEYNNAVMQYLKEDDVAPFYSVLERALYNKMEVLMQLTARE